VTAAAPDPGLAEAALAVAHELAAAAEPAGDRCTWSAEIAVGVEGDELQLGHGDVGASLYDGTAGIAVALAGCAAAGETAGSGPLSDAARGAARHALAGAPAMLETGQLGLFGGATGVALGAVTAGQLCGEAGLVESGTGLAREVAARLEAHPGDELDLIGGLAGTVLGLQRLLGPAAAGNGLAAAGGRLAAAAVPQAWGAAWPAAPGEPPLLGLGHGAAGIALALGELSAAGGDARLALACAEGIEYERGWFDPDRVAWPDLREPGSEPADPDAWTSAWCHGAIGIGLTRLRLAQLSEDPVLAVEASAALQAARDMVVSAGTALREGQAGDCTACHGLAGVAELLLVAAGALGVPDHARAAQRVAALMLEQRAEAGAWPCGLPGAGEVPALMTGTAGIALTLLRASGATTVPTPLLPGPALL
jgi:lantibiotic modifying enzyme